MEKILFDQIPQEVQAINTRLERIEEILKTQAQPESDKLLTVKQTAEYLNLSVASIYRLISQRTIPHKKIPGQKRVYFIKSEIDSWIDENSRKTVKEIEREVDGKVKV